MKKKNTHKKKHTGAIFKCQANSLPLVISIKYKGCDKSISSEYVYVFFLALIDILILINLNFCTKKISIKYKSYSKSRKIDVFGLEICFCRNICYCFTADAGAVSAV